MQADFIEGFTWAVRNGFLENIAFCRFEPGDTLYDSRDAYLVSWGEAVTRIKYSVQVIASTSATSIGAGVPADDDEEEEASGRGSVFQFNWNTGLRVRISEYPSGVSVEMDTTGGRVYTLLWKGGDPKICLQLNAEAPVAPAMASAGNKLLDQLLPTFKDKAAAIGLQKPNLFLMASDSAFGETTEKFRRIEKACESICLPRKTFALLPKDHPVTAPIGFAPTVTFLAVAVDSGKIERFRDALKGVLWPAKVPSKLTFDDVLRGEKPRVRRGWTLRRHGLFSSYKGSQPPINGIRVQSFGTHPPFYRYRLHQDRLAALPPSLSTFLRELFENTPNHLFTDTALKASAQKSEAIAGHITPRLIPEHEISLIARNAKGDGSVSSAHEILQKYALENDQKTVACEVPVWLEPMEVKDFAQVFGKSATLTGHIDFLRLESTGKIGVWDYKPGAFHEKAAHIQVFIYAFVLSIRTGIPLSKFTCGYFDEGLAFTFEPQRTVLNG